MGIPSLSRIIKDFDLVLKVLEIVLCANGASVEVLYNRNGHRLKLLGEGKSVIWGGARTKVEGQECKIIKNMFLHSDQLKLRQKKNITSLIFSLTKLCFTIRKLTLRFNGIKRYIGVG